MPCTVDPAATGEDDPFPRGQRRGVLQRLAEQPEVLIQPSDEGVHVCEVFYRPGWDGVVGDHHPTVESAAQRTQRQRDLMHGELEAFQQRTRPGVEAAPGPHRVRHQRGCQFAGLGVEPVQGVAADVVGRRQLDAGRWAWAEESPGDVALWSH